MNKEELQTKALEIGAKYGQADKPKKIEVGEHMTTDRRPRRYSKKRKDKKGL